MDVLIPIFGVMIPLVAIVGGISYQIFTRWQEGEERKHQMQSVAGADDLRLRISALENDLASMRAELVERNQDMDERLARIEILLTEVE